MDEKHNNTMIAIIGIVAVVAIFGIILLLNSNSQKDLTGNAVPYACWKVSAKSVKTNCPDALGGNSDTCYVCECPNGGIIDSSGGTGGCSSIFCGYECTITTGKFTKYTNFN